MKETFMTIQQKLFVAAMFASAWVAFCVWFDQQWFVSLIDLYGIVAASLIIFGLAFAPGFMAMFVLVGLLLDKRPLYEPREDLPDISIIIAAYNEKDAITHTCDSIIEQDYPSKVNIIIIDDGSDDGTSDVFDEWLINSNYDSNAFSFHSIGILENVGKAAALNIGLDEVKTEHVITLDADSILYTHALRNIMTSMVSGDEKTAGVAGTILARNSRTNWITKLQEFDYFLGIAVIKRVQSLFNGTMVLPGAFSVYKTKFVRELGGWPDAIGEDIVLSYGMIAENYHTGYAENAFVFTNVPETYSQLFKQRKRWGRGLVEAFKAHINILKAKRMTIPFIYNSLMAPYLDIMFVCVLFPGILMAIFLDFYAIAGIMTLYFLPIAVLLTTVQFIKQRRIFKENGLEVRQNLFGFVLYILIFQLLVSTASILGYAAELSNKDKKWGTK